MTGCGFAFGRTRLEADRTDGVVPEDELGAHVSSAGGVDRSPARARQVESVCFQVFTKQPSRWAEREVDDGLRKAFLRERRAHGIRVAGSHDSYLINLSSPDRTLWRRSVASFTAELRRCARLELDFLVTHPGNATDGDEASGLDRNVEGLLRALEAVEGRTRILLEITAGTGTSVGASFANLGRVIEGVPARHRSRLGVCIDTCHAWSAGYDWVGDYEGVIASVEAAVGLERVGLFHLNDSKNPFGSRRDRHEHIGEGSLGLAPFRRLLADERFAGVPKLLETPKDGDAVEADLRNLRRLRGLRE